MDQNNLNSAHLLLNRLERISADSPWAHQASGVRASLAKCLARKNCQPDRIENLLRLGYQILEKAARQVPPTDEKPAF